MTDDTADRRGTGQRSFLGQALEGADFAGADVRGADFTGADLRSASFEEADLGVRPAIGVTFLALGMLLAVAAGATIGWAVNGTTSRLASDAWDEQAEGASLVLLLVIFVAVMLWRGIDVALKAVVIVYPVLLVLSVAANLIWEEVEYLRIARATALIACLILAVGAGIFGRVIGGVFGSWSIAVVAVLGGVASGRVNGGVVGIMVAGCLVFIAKRAVYGAVQGDDRDASVRRLAQRLVRRWGTRFVDADLTGADFTGANAGRCDVRGATLLDVQWDPEHTQPVDAPTPGHRSS